MTRACFLDCEKCGSELKVKIARREYVETLSESGDRIGGPSEYYRVTDHPYQCRGCTDFTGFPEYPQDVLQAAYNAGEDV